MIPGPILIIPCPQCGHTGKKKTLVSGNTFGAELCEKYGRLDHIWPVKLILWI